MSLSFSFSIRTLGNDDLECLSLRLVVRNKWNNPYRALLAQYLTQSKYLSLVMTLILLIRSVIERLVGKLGN